MYENMTISMQKARRGKTDSPEAGGWNGIKVREVNGPIDRVIHLANVGLRFLNVMFL